MKRVLVADDKASSVELVRTVLEASGYEVFEASNGVEAVARAKEVAPHAIILDLQMPKLDGFGTIEVLRSDPALAKIPVMALTASAMMGDRERALAAGFTSYLTKPIPLAALRAEVTRLVEMNHV